MRNLIIGSTAIKAHFPDFNRNPKDLDYVVEKKDQKNTKEVEYLENPVLFKYQKEGYLEPSLLYTLKVSHLVYIDLNWSKHLWDFLFLKNKGCKINLELFYELYEYWGTIHPKNRRSNLDMSASEFFDNALEYPIPHDEIHEILLEHPYFEGQQRPMYTKVLKNGAEVAICEEKFLSLTHKEKMNLVIEEVVVMAQERNFHKNYKINYFRMLKKFVISHCILPESIFILENWVELEKCPFNYKEFLNEKTKQHGLQEA